MKAYPFLTILLACVCLADIVQLNDGKRIEGKIQRESGGWAVTDENGKVTHLTDGEVKSIEKGSSLTPAQLADQQLGSLRKYIDTQSDIAGIMERLNRFVDQHKGSAAAEEARKDLAMWKERQEKKLVKVAGKWVTPEEQAAMMGKLVSMIDEARDMLKQGRLREADAAVTRLLAVDPTNVSGLYLKGVMAARQDQTAEAQKYFEKVRDQLPDHAPTLNNLAVVYFRAKPARVQGAVSLLDLAMVAAPKSRVILDNMAEARHVLTPRDQENYNVRRALQHFDEQDRALAAALEQQGLHRWGSSWVNKDQMEQINKAKAKIQDKLDAVKGEIEKVQARLQAIDDTIKANNREIARMSQDRYVTDSRGVSVQLPLPSAYYTLKRDNERLQAEADGLFQKHDQLMARGRQIEQEMPFPQYTGAMKMIDVEGTPLVMPANMHK